MKIKIAGLGILLENRYEYVERLAKDYVCDFDTPDIVVSATDAEIKKEREGSLYNFDDGYLESIVLYRNIAERLPMHDAIVFHGAVIAYDGSAYAVTARSGVGKTTHLRLWQKEFGDSVHILNGDKPILRIIDGRVYACGTPWRGTEGYGINEMLPLCGIGFLERAAENSQMPLKAHESVMRFMSQIYVPRAMAGASGALALANRILGSVPLCELRVNMDAEAAHMAKKAFSSRLL